MIVGVTGLIGSGKSTATDFLREAGGIIIDADLIGRQVVESSSLLKRKLAAAFGKDVLTSKGNLRRSVVAERAFTSRKSQLLLNSIVHPYLLKELRKQLQAAQKKSRLVVIDAALLLDWKLDHEVDTVLLVHAPVETRIKRLVRRGLSRADAVARTGSQKPYRFYRSRSDIVVLNNGTRPDLYRKLRSKLGSFI
ncbi:MAG: dephospho-CoA kinase [bacterium]|nr:dephospho-CoA kinase [bacterium]